MRIMIASDIHGSAYYCRKLIDRYKVEKPDKLLLLGDILYHGPRNDLPKEYNPKAVIELLNSMKEEIMCVRGNCDAEVDQMVLEFPIMAESCTLYSGSTMIFVTHGHTFNIQNPPMLKEGDILLHGHTHIPAKEKFDGKIYINPGSVSIPKEGSRHGYMMLEDDVFTWKDLDGHSYKQMAIDTIEGEDK